MGTEGRDRSSWEAIGGIAVGASALLISVYTAYLEHRHAQAELWPRVELLSSDEGGGYKIEIVNKGTGPASIRDLKRRIDGHPVTTWTPWIDTLAGRHVPIGNFTKYDIRDATLSAGESVTIFATSDGDVGEAIRDSRHVEETSICYCSVFEDCWVLDHRSRKPVPVPECSQPGPESWIGLGEAEKREIEALYGAGAKDAGRSGPR